MREGIFTTAIYARQSADRVDSISIETQIEMCTKQLSEGESFEVFSDRGYTGANTDRPMFRKMLSLCRKGEISRIITYKLDRISRSLLDFVLLLEELEKHRTELVSCTESFSSNSEMGVLIMKLLVMFAEMERKNIRMRVRDNYYSRAEKGFYLGGYAPFGYKKTDLIILQKKTSGYEIIEDEKNVVEEIYYRFAVKKESASSICRSLNRRKITTRKGCLWSPTTLVRLIKNPFYVKADWKIYAYFLETASVVTSPPESFDGTNGILCYGEKNNSEQNGSSYFSGKHITVGRHKGIVASDLWLKAVKRLESDKPTAFSASPKTFLTGLVVCGECQKKYTVTSSRGYVYLYCRGRKNASCNSEVTSLRADFLEKITERLVVNKLCSLSRLKKNPPPTPEENTLRCEIENKKARLSELKERLKTADSNSLDFIYRTISEMICEMKEREKMLEKLVEKKEKMCYTEIEKLARAFRKYDCVTKKAIVGEIVEKAVVCENEICIYLRHKPTDSQNDVKERISTMIKGVIFDMDGLMIDTESLLVTFWCEAARLHGFDMKKEHVLGIRSLASKFAEPNLKGIFGDGFDYQSVRKKRIELMNAYIEENGIEKKKGLDELLLYLKNHGIKTAVATATDLERTTLYLKKIGVFDAFDKIICGPMVKNGKPEPDIYLKASAELGLEPCECLALEDSPNGILSAHRAGCVPVMIPDLTEPDDELLKLCAKRLDSLDMVIDFIEDM